MSVSMEPQSPALPSKSLQDPELKRTLQRLRKTDNWRNWIYLGRAYLIIALAVTGAVLFHQWQQANGINPLWNIPIFLLSIVVIGASQHQLAGATHEATHHILFKNRKLNELVSDWLCMFPLFSSTYVFRLHHLAHHQFINDPEKDPDFSQLRESGHWLRFPVTSLRFLRKLVSQWWIVPLVHYIFVRAKYNSIGVDNNPYNHKKVEYSPWPIRLGLITLAGWLIASPFLYYFPSESALLIGAGAGWALVVGILLLIPTERYPVTRLTPVISPKTTMVHRVTFLHLLFLTLFLLQYRTGAPVLIYFHLLWVAPIFTAFSFFMILRQLVQHGNGDRGWLTNTRTFLVNPFIKYAVFPFGMDYHLPHHMFASIPHYRLPDLHRVLMEYPEYREGGIVVEGYFIPKGKGPGRNPTVMEVIGPGHARSGSEVFIDESVVEDQLSD